MIVYFSANHRELDQRSEQLKYIVELIRLNGGTLVNEWLETAIMRTGGVSTPLLTWKDICYEAELGIRAAEAIVVEASGAAALGNGYELALGLSLEKPVLALITDKQFNDSYTSGLTHKLLTVKKYSKFNIQEVVQSFMASLEIR